MTIKILASILLTLHLSIVLAANVNGPTSVFSGSTYTYSYNDGTSVSTKLNNFNVTPNGTILSRYISADGIYRVDIQWNVAGPGTVFFTGGTSLSVTVGQSPPVAITAINITSTSFTARWNESTGASSYRLDVSMNASFSVMVSGYNDLSAGANSSVNVTGLTEGTTYYYRVRAVNSSAGTSGNSNTISIITLPPSPVALAATNVTSSSFAANWSSVAIATGYRLDVSTSSSFASFISGYNNLTVTGTNSSVTGLLPNTTYYFRVRSVNGSTASANSNTMNVKTLLVSSVQGPTSVMSGETHTYNYNDGTSIAERLSYFNVTPNGTILNRYLAADGTYRADIQWNVAGPGTVYFTGGNSLSVTVSQSPPVAISATDVTLTSFTARWNILSGASNYQLDVATDLNFSDFVSGYNNLSTGPNSNISVTGLTAGVTYYYRVRAVNSSAGTSGNSNIITVRLIPSAPLALPASNITSNSFTANWENSSGSPDSYRIYVSTNSLFSSYLQGYNGLLVSGTSLNISGLSEKTTYYYRLKAVNSSGISDFSNTVLGVSLSRNYILSEDVMQDGVTSESQLEALSTSDKMVSYAFFDGLGRPSQKVFKQQSPHLLDIVQPVVYDSYGREAVQYLPYTSGNDGWFKPDFVTNQNSDYTQSPQYQFYHVTSGVAVDDRPFSETFFEKSPLNQIIKQAAPGQAWLPQDDPLSLNDKTLKKRYEINDNQEVYILNYNVPTAKITLGDGGQNYYSSGLLYREVTYDEHNGEIIEYTNKEGEILCKKVFSHYLGSEKIYACTYYIYDDLGNLVCVLQPEGVKNIGDYFAADNNGKEDFLKKWAFRYKYDGKKRLIVKQVAGGEPVYMIYDDRDRLVMTQDGNQRLKTPKEWTFTKYDVFNRLILTGIYKDVENTDQNGMQEKVDQFYFAANTNSDEWFEVKGTSVHGYTNQSFPKVNEEADYLTVAYYDDYSFVSNISVNNTAFEFKTDELPLADGTSHPAQQTQANDRVVGQVTGAKIKRLMDNTWLWSVNYYDNKYRIIQITAHNHKGGIDRTTQVYDFTGKLLRSKITHTIAGTSALSVTRKFEYDHAGRILKLWHQVGSSGKILLSQNEYNELGQLTTKKLHSTDLESIPDASRVFKETVEYRYNIRGWLTHINDPDTDEGLFNMALKYNDPTTNGGQSLYNGNISEIIWTGGDSRKQSYGYYYDTLNRIKEARYFDYIDITRNGRFNEKIGGINNKGYDLNGNILKLSRSGKLSDMTYGVMDELTYTYNGNQLTRIDDAVPLSTTESGFKEQVKTANEYIYDPNGNMKKDQNKGISTIEYNFLNLPSKINKTESEYLTYTYDATGRKLTQQVYGSATKITDYMGDFIYENGVLQFINHEEGRVVMTAAEPEYQYHLKDHLGNVRLTFTTKEETQEITATMESSQKKSEQTEFVGYEHVTRVNSVLFNHTDKKDSNYSIRLNGTNNERIGLSRSMSVMPGDKIKLEVYAKYVVPDSENLSTALSSMLTSLTIAAGSSPVLTEGRLNIIGGNSVFPFDGLLEKSADEGNGPKAYLNYLVFDSDYNLIAEKSGFKRMTEQAKETGTDVEHERLSHEIDITERGYVYIYLSNENETPVEVFFDDFSVQQVKGPVVQMDDYYPFGLTFNNYQKENSLINHYLYNRKEQQDEMDLGWVDFGARMYMPEIGRWGVQDPKSEIYSIFSPYGYAVNNPIIFVDPDGMDIVYYDSNGNVLVSVASENINRTFVATESRRKQNRVEWMEFAEAEMPGIIKGYEDPKYQEYDHDIAAHTYIFNHLSNDNLPADTNGEKNQDERAPELDPTLVKAIALKETTLGTVNGNNGQNGKSDIMQANVTLDNGQSDWDDSKAAFGLKKGESATPNQSIYAGIRILYQKGLTTDKGVTSWTGGNDWFKAVERYNGGGTPGYADKVKKYYNSAVKGQISNYRSKPGIIEWLNKISQ